MVMRTISAGSAYGHSPECIAWTQTYTADYRDIHTAVIDTDAQAVTFLRFRRRDGTLHADTATGEPEEAAPEVLPLRALPDVLDVLAAIERHDEQEQRYRARRLARARQEVVTAP